MHKNFQRVTVYLLVAMLFACTLSATNTVLDWKKPVLGVAPLPVEIDWKTLYPFKKENAQVRKFSVSNAWLRLCNRIKWLQDKTMEFSKKIFYYETFVESAVKIEKFLAMPNVPVTGEYYTILSNDYIIVHNRLELDVTQMVKSLGEFNHFLRSKNIALLYVQIPGKISKEDEVTFKYSTENKNADNLLFALKQANISYLDLRQEIHKQGLVHHNLFFKTDHHWKPEAGLWATKVIAERLNDSFGFDIDTSLYSPERYGYQVYDDFLGSIGRRVTLAVAKLEPISFPFPKFDTDLKARIPSIGVDKRVNFRILPLHIQEESVYKKFYYDTYFHDGTVVFLHNNLASAKKKILMIRDSFSNVITPFLALGVEDTTTVDLREANGNFSGSVQSLVEKISPDIVLILYNTADLPAAGAFNFR